jgi:alanine racemase
VNKNFFQKPFKTLNLIEIQKRALLHNFRYFQKLHPESQICLVLKSNAYGHGLKLVGKFIDKEIKPTFLAVDSLYEAYELEKVGIKTPILLLGYTFPENFKIWRKLNFSLPVYDKKTAIILNQYQPGVKVHLKIDTGMNRLGIKPKQALVFVGFLKKCQHLQIEGIYTHLSLAANKNSQDFTQKQIKLFKQTIEIFEKEGFRFRYKHVSATAGAMQVFDPEFNLLRIGRGFYGISPFEEGTKFDQVLTKNLQPAMRFLTHIVQVKTIDKGDRVSYGGTFTAQKKMKIGILPLGYYDGLNRDLSNKGVVRIGDKFCPIIGQICMNLTMIDISQIKKTKVGEQVVVFDNQTSSPNSFLNSARLIKTIPSVLMVNLSESTRRILV